MPNGSKGRSNKGSVSMFDILGSLFGLGGANAATPELDLNGIKKIKIKTQGIDNGKGQSGFGSLAEKINFGGGFR